jgi:transcriptional regulator with XRE-family HTH domain
MGRHPSRRHVAPEEAPIGRRIRGRRRELGITQAELAGPEYTKSFISQLESGYADPSLDTLRFLGRRLRLSLSGMAGDVLDQRLAVLDGLLAWAHERRAAGDLADAQRALDTIGQLAAGNSGDVDGPPHIVESHLLLAEIALDEGRVDAAERAVDAVAATAVGPRLNCWRGIVAGRVALRRDDAPTALARFKAAAGHTRSATRFPDLAVRAAVGVAAANALQGDLKPALRRVRAAAAVAARYGLTALRGRVLLRLAWLAAITGDHALAVAEARAGEALIATTANRHAETESAQVLARLSAAHDGANSPGTGWPIDPSI